MQVCKARVIAKSKSAVTGKIITTIEAEFSRIVLAEFNTHKSLNRNASSSRAIPVPKMIEQARTNPAFPARFGAANKGMQDAGEHDRPVVFWDANGNLIELSPEEAWRHSANIVADIAEAWHKAGYAKQICNRWIETVQMMKVVITGTEWENFFWLRDHGAADPTIEQLAKVIRKAMDETEAVELQPGEWHVPYYNSGYWKPSMVQTIAGNGEAFSVVVDSFGHSLEHALTISSSCCAQVSFRSLDDTIEKAQGVVAKLNLHGEEPDEPVHASPLEHQATPIAESEPELKFQTFDPSFDAFVPKMIIGKVNVLSKPHTWEEGITHMDRDGTLCSGNLKGFIQHRQLVPNHVKRG